MKLSSRMGVSLLGVVVTPCGDLTPPVSRTAEAVPFSSLPIARAPVRTQALPDAEC